MAVAEDPVEIRVRKELADNGVNLDDLLDGGKVVSLTRQLDQLSLDATKHSESSTEYQTMQTKINKLETKLVFEKRQVMQKWLKQLFVAQAIGFAAVGGFLANDAVPGYHLPLVAQAFGFWLIWLFTIPSLRARKGTTKSEKSALNVSFLATPILNLILPTFTKNCGLIWAADVSFLVACYMYYASTATNSMVSSEGKPATKQTAKISGILKYLDWGSWR